MRVELGFRAWAIAIGLVGFRGVNLATAAYRPQNLVISNILTSSRMLNIDSGSVWSRAPRFPGLRRFEIGGSVGPKTLNHMP